MKIITIPLPLDGGGCGWGRKGIKIPPTLILPRKGGGDKFKVGIFYWKIFNGGGIKWKKETFSIAWFQKD